MSEKNVNPNGYEMVDRVINQRINEARKAEVLVIYEELLQTIWNRILPTLGRVTTIAIMERAIILCKENYPVIEHVKIRPDGLTLQVLRESINESELDIIREALKELVADLIDILAMLTGDILVKQLITEIEGRRSQ